VWRVEKGSGLRLAWGLGSIDDLYTREGLVEARPRWTLSSADAKTFSGWKTRKPGGGWRHRTKIFTHFA